MTTSRPVHNSPQWPREESNLRTQIRSLTNSGARKRLEQRKILQTIGFWRGLALTA
jgi:hypothetical protein